MTAEEALTLVEQFFEERQLTKVERLVFQHAWQGFSYPEIAQQEGYDTAYIKNVSYRLWRSLSERLGEKITKQNLNAAIKRCSRRLVEISTAEHQHPHRDWGEAMDVSNTYGREAELATLKQWILGDRCRIVGIWGMGGIGKSTLSIKLAQKIQDNFDYIIWRSLRSAPAAKDVIAGILKCINSKGKYETKGSVGDLISLLLQDFKDYFCLMILDDFEAVFQSGSCAGCYQEKCKEYGELLRLMGEVSHKSCLLLVSREKPEEISLMEGEFAPVRSMHLAGVEQADADRILKVKGLNVRTEEVQDLVRRYRGNPLALKIAATSIVDLFAGDIASFLAQNTTVLHKIYKMLEEQFERLCSLEKTIMYWLAINQISIPIAELQRDIFPPVSMSALFRNVESLRKRSLIKIGASGVTQQPIVMEYTIEQFLNQLMDEIAHIGLIEDLNGSPIECAGRLYYLQHYAILKATSQEHVRQSQIREIVQPLADRLLAIYGTPLQITERLYPMLWKLLKCSAIRGYAGGNLLNLLGYLGVDLTGADFSNLSLWQADLANVPLRGVNLACTDLSKSRFCQPPNNGTVATPRLYEGANLTGAIGLASDQQASLRALGAILDNDLADG